MHVTFRQFAQQMGMQNVRAILPEQIDMLINTSISDILNQLIRENVSITNDRVITDNSKLGQINAFRTLYNVNIIDLCPTPRTDKEYRAFHFAAKDRNTGKLSTQFARIPTSGTDPIVYETNIPESFFIVDFSLNYRQVKDGKGYTGVNNAPKRITYDIQGYQSIGDYFKRNVDGDQEIHTKASDDLSDDEGSDVIVKLDDEKKVLQIISDPENNNVGCFLNISQDADNFYQAVSKIDQIDFNPVTNVRETNTSTTVEFSDDSLETNFFPVRLIDDIYLADTLNDFILKPRLRSPIMVVYTNDEEQVMDLYIEKFNKVGDRFVLTNNLVPYQLRMSYIAKPAKVEFREDFGENNIECNLPESMHIDIIKHAVDLYRVTTSGALHANQGQGGQQEAPNNTQQ